MQLSEAIVSIMEEDDGEIELGRLIEPCLMAKHSMKLFLRMVKLNLLGWLPLMCNNPQLQQPPLSKKMAAMVGCWWQPTTIV